MDIKDVIGIVISSVALVVSLISFVVTLREKRRAKQDALVKALQGEKESIAYVAFQLARGAITVDPVFRDELLASLCLAGVFESSDRCRALVYEAIRECSRTYASSITQHLDRIEAIFGQYPQPEKIGYAKERVTVLRNLMKTVVPR
jgi:hypothetical protein